MHILVWVNDVIVASASAAAVAAGKQLIAARFDARDMGVVSTFLGMTTVHLEPGGRIMLSSPGHVAAVLEAYGTAGCRQLIRLDGGEAAAGGQPQRGAGGQQPLPSDHNQTGHRLCGGRAGLLHVGG